MPSHSHLTAAALVAMTPALALAWMPEPPPGYGPQGYGYPGFPPPYSYPDMGPPTDYPWAGPRGAGAEPKGSPPQGGPATEGGLQPPLSAPRTQPGEPGPYGAPYGTPYGYPYGLPYGPMGEHARVTPGQLRVSREVTEDAYLVRILVSDGKTDEIQVAPLGRSLAISRNADAQTVQEDTFDEGRGYQRSFSFSRGAVSQRVGLPPDADLGAMTREVKDGTITLRIPRNLRGDLGLGYRPDQPPAPGETPQGARPANPPAPTQTPVTRP